MVPDEGIEPPTFGLQNQFDGVNDSAYPAETTGLLEFPVTRSTRDARPTTTNRTQKRTHA
jgi:hypothetical protein